MRLPIFVAIAAMLVSLAATAAPVAPRAIGLIIDPSPATNPVPFVRFGDTLIETLAGSRQWEPTALHPDNPLVRVSGATWPRPAGGDWLAGADALQSLLVATQLDDLLVVRPVPSAANELDVLWLRQGEPEIRRSRVSQAGAGDQAYAALSRQVLAMLDQGPPSVPAVERVAVKPESPPTTPTTPEAPAATQPEPGAAVGVGGHEAPAATTPEPPPTAAPAGPELTKPEPSPASPAAEPVTPETPATPTAPDGAAPAAPTQPRQPSEFLPAARKYLNEGEFKKVEDMLLRAQEAGDSRGQIYLMWAELEQARQNPTAERTWLQRALEADNTITAAHLRLAELLRQGGLWKRAAEEYQTVIEADPKALHAHLGLSALYASQNQPRRAAEILTQALEHYPQDANLYLRIGDLHAQRQAWAEAENAYDKAARLSEGEERADALDRLGDLYVAAAREREGFICYGEASRLRAGTPAGMSEKRYQQIMQAADSGLLKAVDRAHTTLQAYLAGQGVYREEAFGALDDLRTQVQEVSGFVGEIAPPASVKTRHLQRRLAYSLTAEAALAGLDYVDQGKPQRLQDYTRLIEEAVATIRELQRGG